MKEDAETLNSPWERAREGAETLPTGEATKSGREGAVKLAAGTASHLPPGFCSVLEKTLHRLFALVR